MLGAGGEHERRPRFRGDIQLVAMQQQLAHALAQRRAPRPPRHQPAVAPLLQPLPDKGEVGALARTLPAFERDEESALLHGAWPPRPAPEKEEKFCRRPFNWYLITALLCSSSVFENSWLPSPREAKYSARVSAGCSTAFRASPPGMGIGVGGGPARGEVGEGVALLGRPRR